jgi:hypothetical protein
MSQDLLSKSVTIPLLGAAGTLGGPQSNVIPFVAIPGTSYGGGITLVRWSYATNVVLALGSAPAISLVTLNSASLPVGTPAANGSAATTAGTAVTGTISTAWVPGTISYLGVKYTQATYGGTSPAYAIVDIDYFHGRGSA